MAIPLIAAAALPSVVKGLSGLFGIGRGRARARRNVRPVETVNQNLVTNLTQAENDARVGLPQEQLNIANQGIQRNLGTGFRILGRSGNPGAGVGSLIRSANDATLNLTAQDSNARMNNRRFVFGQRANLANEENRVFDWNQKRRFQEEAAAASDEIGAGRQNAFGALTDLSQLGQTLLGEQDISTANPVNDWRTGYGRIKKFSNRGY